MRQRLVDEVGRIDKVAARRVALVYPSPYAVGMSSLGYQRIYRAIQAMPGVACERVFLDDGGEDPGADVEAPVSYEETRPLPDFPLLAFSVAYELQLAGLVRMLDAAGIPPERALRRERDPFVLMGGPLTFSNPSTLSGYADAVVLGEAEELVAFALGAILDAPSKQAALAALAAHPHVFVPALQGATLPSIAACDDALLPAFSAIRTPHTELSDMFLIETERGCHRGCTYCVMRRSTNGGMRLVAPAKVKSLIPEDAHRVGLVGAAVTDHPGLPEILRHIVESGREVGISSLRADRLDDEIVGLLKRGGYRTLTTASDGASEAMRDRIQRKTKERHLIKAAELARAHGMKSLKLYMMLGLPGETTADIDELGRFSVELSRIAPRLVLGIAPFVAKRNTPLDGAAFEPIDVLDAKLARLRTAVAGRVTLRPTSPKWAWVEYRLAQGGVDAGRAAARAARAGGRFADWKAAFADVPAPAASDAAQAPTVAIASISTRAPLGRPAA